MNEFEIWIYRSTIAGLLIIIWYFAKGILSQLKEMNQTLRSLNDKALVHDGKIELVQEKVTCHENRINDHGKRLKSIEHNQDICPACP